MQLSKSEVQHIANLARLELTDAEVATYGEQLSAVLDYMEVLKEVDVTGVEPTAQVTGLTNVARDDVAEEWPADEVEAALAQAPERLARRSRGEGGEGRYIKVRRVL